MFNPNQCIFVERLFKIIVGRFDKKIEAQKDNFKKQINEIKSQLEQISSKISYETDARRSGNMKIRTDKRNARTLEIVNHSGFSNNSKVSVRCSNIQDFSLNVYVLPKDLTTILYYATFLQELERGKRSYPDYLYVRGVSNLYYDNYDDEYNYIDEKDVVESSQNDLLKDLNHIGIEHEDEKGIQATKKLVHKNDISQRQDFQTITGTVTNSLVSLCINSCSHKSSSINKCFRCW